MKGRCISEWLTWSRRSSSPQGREGLAVINGISCVPTRTGAVPCCGDLLEENSFAADRDGAGVSPTARSFLVKLTEHIVAKQRSRLAYRPIAISNFGSCLQSPN